MPNDVVIKPAVRKPLAKAAAPRNRRAIGRPQSGEPAVGREALLEKTCELLRTTPPGQISRADVARFANVDPGLIRYYFKDTPTLLVAAAESLCVRFGETLARIASLRDTTPEARIRARIAALLDLEIEQPFFNRLMIESVLNSNTPAAIKLMNDVTARGVSAYRSVLEEGWEQGQFRQVDSVFLHFAIIGLCEFFVPGLPMLGVATGEKAELARFREPYRDFICELVINGLRQPPGAAASPERERARPRPARGSRAD